MTGWTKSSACDIGASCVWVAPAYETVVVTKAGRYAPTWGHTMPMLNFTHDEWRAFIAGVKAGEFDIEAQP